MKLSKRWLHDYIKPEASEKEFADAMTISGSKVEGFETEGAELRNIVVGKLLSIERHENSDHLWVCQVDAGGAAPLQIVTGAQNLKAGDVVPVALDDSTVVGKEIHAGDLRGVRSDGMLCSLSELGLSVHDFPYAIEDGIFVLGEDCDQTLGLDACKAIGLDDVITEFEITPNRPDCLSVLGLAREASATFGLPYTPPELSERPLGGAVDSFLKVRIEEREKCYRYAGAVVENVRVAPSPRWMRERLRASGVRPINNIVDITNYVMLEYGQPMHAFDLRYLEGGQVIVRNAGAGESITTLDGIQRKLSEDMLVIADAAKPVAVAGVMGGEYSGIMADTQIIVFESACFNGASVRITAKKLGMRTESSGRFEKGLDPQGCAKCLNRALDLVRLLDAGDVVEGIVDCDYSDATLHVLPFDPEGVNNFIGISVSAEEQRHILEQLEFRVEDGQITVPSFRGDVEHPADIAEEIARIYGYDKIENRPLAGVADGHVSREQSLEAEVRETLLACGLSEIVTYSFISPKAYDKIALPADSPLQESIVIQNPLGEDTSVMRSTALPSLLDVLSRNYNYRNPEAGLFELATTYHPVSAETEALPEERKTVMLGLYGKDCSFYSVKGVVETLLEVLDISGWEIEAVTGDPAFHPGRRARLLMEGEAFALFGEIHPQVLENYGIGIRAYAAAIDFPTLLQHAKDESGYRPLPKYPAAMRDLAFVCDKSLTVLSLERVITGAAGEILEQIDLFDIYEGEQIPAGKKSVAFTLRLRSPERTLTDEETDAAVGRAVEALQEMGVTLRG